MPKVSEEALFFFGFIPQVLQHGIAPGRSCYQVMHMGVKSQGIQVGIDIIKLQCRSYLVHFTTFSIGHDVMAYW